MKYVILITFLCFLAQANKPNIIAKPANPTLVAAVKIDVEKLLLELKKHYSLLKSTQFNFEQSYKTPFLPTLETSKGVVFYKDQKILWRYDEPKNRQKAFYINGSKLIYHMISDKIAYTNDCFEQDALSLSISFLWGKGDLKNSFVIQASTDTSNNKDLRWLLLTPKDKNLNVESILLGILAKEAKVVESIVIDKAKGRNHFKFTNFLVNPSTLKDDLFIFKPLKDTKVQTMPGVVCTKKIPPKTNNAVKK